MKKWSALVLIVVTCMAFVTITNKFNEGENPEFINPSKQRTGNAAIGYTYLTTGDYLKNKL